MGTEAKQQNELGLASFLAYACSFQVLVGSDFLRGFVGPWGAARAWLCRAVHREAEQPLLPQPPSALTLT